VASVPRVFVLPAAVLKTTVWPAGVFHVPTTLPCFKRGRRGNGNGLAVAPPASV
jgi:hypothetical protein